MCLDIQNAKKIFFIMQIAYFITGNQLTSNLYPTDYFDNADDVNSYSLWFRGI